MKLLKKTIELAAGFIGGESRRFHRDDGGTIVAVLAMFSIPLLLMFFVMINTGTALLTKMRAQGLADSASYSGAVWQARFLNYCAYTRRHIIGNYATMAMLTGYIDSGHTLVKHVYRAKRLKMTLGGALETQFNFGKIVNKFLRGTFNALKGALNFGFLYPDDPRNWRTISGHIDSMGLRSFLEDGGLETMRATRQACDLMNGFLSESQKWMYFNLMAGGGISAMSDTIDYAQGGTTHPTRFSLDKSNSLFLINNLERRAIPLPEIRQYFDKLAMAEVPCGPDAIFSNIVSLLKNGYHGGMPGIGFYSLARKARWNNPSGTTYSDLYYFQYKHDEFLFIARLILESDAVNLSNEIIRAETYVPAGNILTGSYYCWFLVWVYVPFVGWVPLFYMTPIVGVPPSGDEGDGYGWHIEKYKMIFPVDRTLVHEFRYPKSASDWEPTCMAAVQADVKSAPFVGFLTTLGVDPQQCLPGRNILAMSRAKAYFRGTLENLKDGYYQVPNLNYPFWGAKLAAIEDHPATNVMARLAREGALSSYRQKTGESTWSHDLMELHY